MNDNRNKKDVNLENNLKKKNSNIDYEQKLINKLKKATDFRSNNKSTNINHFKKQNKNQNWNNNQKHDTNNHNIPAKQNENKNQNISNSFANNPISFEIPNELKVNYNKYKDLNISNNLKTQKDTTYIFAMGGLEEIGKNMYVIEHNDEIIVVDVGIKFASSDMLGVNGIVPNFDYFKKNNKKINKLIITHGHEDHIGGVPYILKEVEIETISSPLLAAELIKRKIGEFKEINKIPNFEIINDDSIIQTKYFKIDFFRVCHSIPDCFGLCIQTPNGNILSAGDYRFDFGKDTDDTNIHKIIEMSNRGIDIFLAESTNSGQAGFSESEDTIIENITMLMQESKGRTFIATFASNLGRIERLIERGINSNKKICIMGRSMEANIKTSMSVGYIRLSEIDFINPKDISNYNDNEILVILTGSQGEEMAALNLMSEGKYSKISLKPTDTVILSSNPIPGNFKSVEILVNKLFKLGVNVIQHSPNLKIHASGHATRQEQQMMLKLINPRYLFPIHGESKMLNSMKENARSVGFDENKIIIATNGQRVELKNKEVYLTNDCVDASAILINGKSPSKQTIKLIQDRKLLSENGIFMAIIMIDKKNNKLYKNPMLTTRGCLFAKNATSLISKISYTIKDEIESLITTNSNYTNDSIEEIVKKNINLYIWKNKRKNPIVLTTIFNKN